MVGLGNPGPEYDETRHNVGWWVVDRVAHEWGWGPFQREGPAWCTHGSRHGTPVTLVKPATFMNRSGAAVAPLRGEEFDPAQDLLVVVDDAALEVGRVRLRPRGSPGGHNGLRSISSVLGTDEYARLRIGVGRPPEGWDWADWVLSPMADEDKETILGLLPELVEAIEAWLSGGVEVAMSDYNR